MLPRDWLSLVPHGIGQQKPYHYLEIARAVWQNRDQLPFAWRILRDGVCDGCALGTSGLRDWTIPGVHLCLVRLDLLRLNTAPGLAHDRLTDHWFGVNTGGDLAFLVGTLKALVEHEAVDRDYVRQVTAGFEAARDAAVSTPWEDIERESGAGEDEIRRFARLLEAKPRTIFVWSMGLTQPVHGVDTIRALINVGLARGLVGRQHCGLMPIRGHSGVQGGAEVGCVPSVDASTAARWADAWGFPVPDAPGHTAGETTDRAAEGGLDVFWIVGGNFLETLAGASRIGRALHRPGLRVHHDIVLSSAMLVEPSDEVILLPATTRYESPGGGTETTTERRIVFSPEVPGRRIGSARPEWWALLEAAARARPERAPRIRLSDAAAIRTEIGRTIPLYRGIERLAAKGDQVQWGGRQLFADGRFATPDGLARFSAVVPHGRRRRDGALLVSTRRGRQFNSMVHRDRDPLTGAGRDAVLMSAEDASAHGLEHGGPVRLVSAHGEFRGRVHVAPMANGNLQVHWPEGLVLLPPHLLDPESKEPDYNVEVRIESAQPPAGGTGSG